MRYLFCLQEQGNPTSAGLVVADGWSSTASTESLKMLDGSGALLLNVCHLEPASRAARMALKKTGKEMENGERERDG